MKKVKYGLLATRPRKLTFHDAVLMKEACQSSAYFMLKRYIKIRKHITKLKDAEVDSLFSSTSDDRRIDELHFP